MPSASFASPVAAAIRSARLSPGLQAHRRNVLPRARDVARARVVVTRPHPGIAPDADGAIGPRGHRRGRREVVTVVEAADDLAEVLGIDQAARLHVAEDPAPALAVLLSRGDLVEREP